MRRGWLWALLLLIAGCAEQPPAPSPAASVPAPETPVAAPAITPELPMDKRPLKHLLGRNLKAQPVKPLTMRSSCSARDEVGTRTKLTLRVKNSEVQALAAEVLVAKHGRCQFALKDFEQREKLPHILLAAKDGSPCTVRIWEQGPKTTVAFNRCPAACEADTFDYLWPIMVDTKSGRCY